jgi:hypothetical protein
LQQSYTSAEEQRRHTTGQEQPGQQGAGGQPAATGQEVEQKNNRPATPGRVQGRRHRPAALTGAGQPQGRGPHDQAEAHGD